MLASSVLLASVAVAVVLAVVVVPGVGRSSPGAAPSVGHLAGHPAGPCRRVSAEYAAALDAPVSAGAPGLIVVVGDSYSQGAGLPTGRAGAFPALLARATARPVFLDGFGSTGFTTRGLCPGRPVTYGERLDPDGLLALRPAAVIVEGGVNDARHGDVPGVEAAAAALLRRLAGVPTVIVVGPAAIPNADPARLAAVDAGLAAATRAAGREYLDLREHPLPMQGDGIHPTGAGQATIAALLVPLVGRSPHAAIS